MKPFYKDVIHQFALCARLAEFEPMIIGTPPLGIATESSDIDIACTAPDLNRFGMVVVREFGQMPLFSLRHPEHFQEPAAIASFTVMGWEIEIFCQNLPINEQWGVRHFRIEEKLLSLAPTLRERVLRLKQDAFKTEHAFTNILNIPGDPFEALLELEGMKDEELRDLIDANQANT